jgi:thiol-disulfide isomerase/thioredoxin
MIASLHGEAATQSPQSYDAEVREFLTRARSALGGSDVVTKARRSLARVRSDSDFGATTQILRLGAGVSANFQTLQIAARPESWGEELVEIRDGLGNITSRRVPKRIPATPARRETRVRGVANGISVDLGTDANNSAFAVTKHGLWERLQEPIVNWDIPATSPPEPDVAKRLDRSASLAGEAVIAIEVADGAFVHRVLYDPETALPRGRIVLESSEPGQHVPVFLWVADNWGAFDGLRYPRSQKLFAYRRPYTAEEPPALISHFRLNLVAIGEQAESERDKLWRELPPRIRVLVEHSLAKDPLHLTSEEKMLREFSELFLAPAKAGSASPEFTVAGYMASALTAAPVLLSATGERVAIDQLRGSVIILQFWASWALPCRAALRRMDSLQQWAESLGGGVRVFAVNSGERAPTGAERISAAKQFWAASDYAFESLFDVDGEALKRYGVQGFPAIVLIGPDGKVARCWTGVNERTIEEVRAAADASRIK